MVTLTTISLMALTLIITRAYIKSNKGGDVGRFVIVIIMAITPATFPCIFGRSVFIDLALLGWTGTLILTALFLAEYTLLSITFFLFFEYKKLNSDPHHHYNTIIRESKIIDKFFIGIAWGVLLGIVIGIIFCAFVSSNKNLHFPSYYYYIIFPTGFSIGLGGGLLYGIKLQLEEMINHYKISFCS